MSRPAAVHEFLRAAISNDQVYAVQFSYTL